MTREPESRADGRLRCELCGRWWVSLSGHIVRSHEMTVREYQIMHGLPVSRGLVSDRLRERQAERQRDVMAGPDGDRLREGIADHARAARARDPEMLKRAPSLRADDVPERIAASLRERVPPLVCAVCGVEFRPSDRRTKTCSDECFRDRAATLVTRVYRPRRDAEMRALHAAGVSYAEIGRRYGMTTQGARYIVRRPAQPE